MNKFFAFTVSTAAAVVAVGCGGGDGADVILVPTVTAPAPAATAVVPWGGPLAADKPLAASYNNAAHAFSASTDNPILNWNYRIWCVSGYRMTNEGGTGQPVDELLDATKDLASTNGFVYSSLAKPMPAGGVKFMENAWYFGTDYLGAVVVKTPEGLVLFDSYTNPADIQAQLIDQMAAAGLDPKQIKYIFLGHEHGDHIGGANYLRKNFAPDAKIVASRAATDAIAASRVRAESATYTGTSEQQAAAKAARLLALPEKIDEVIEPFAGIDNGMRRIRTGTTTEVVAIVTPGHTPGQMTMVVPVAHQGTTHKLLIWSGNDNINKADQYATSTDFAAGITLNEGADAFINTHPYQGAIFSHLRALKTNPGAANPLIMGVEGVRRYFGIYAACQRAGAQRLRDGTWKAL